jgi:hypothetical protein
MNTWDFLPEFSEALKKHLEEDAKEWGDTWLKRTRKGQGMRMIMSTNDRFDKFLNGKQSIDYLAIAGDSLINWIREQHPDFWEE